MKGEQLTMKKLVLTMSILVVSVTIYSQTTAQTRYDRTLSIFDPDASGSGVVVSFDLVSAGPKEKLCVPYVK